MTLVARSCGDDVTSRNETFAVFRRLTMMRVDVYQSTRISCDCSAK